MSLYSRIDKKLYTGDNEPKGDADDQLRHLRTAAFHLAYAIDDINKKIKSDSLDDDTKVDKIYLGETEILDFNKPLKGKAPEQPPKAKNELPDLDAMNIGALIDYLNNEFGEQYRHDLAYRAEYIVKIKDNEPKVVFSVFNKEDTNNFFHPEIYNWFKNRIRELNAEREANNE